MIDLNGKVVLVTGTDGTIGTGIAASAWSPPPSNSTAAWTPSSTTQASNP
ncbi:hypothetical protein ACWGE0_25090 [Lentzea sp. NPDC054927]